MGTTKRKRTPAGKSSGPLSAFDSPTFNLHMSIRVDQPVGSASISPCGRDVVLASRQGLHIIDLDSPYSPPRHLPHRTPWEVADVQWSPFAARHYWVISTSNQKALVWNLATKSPHNAIEYVLHAHSRAITDINFSAHHPDVLATCAVDSFVHCWDLRSPARPSRTYCDWFAGATQVKWNRQDPHIIASSHDRYLRIWDARKGAYPLRSIEAHSTKIYGIDWNRTRPSGIVTCSLDKSIKFWDYERQEDEPERIVRTPFPVWRARHTPFGWGLLAMPQRENSDLHLYDRRLHDGEPADGMVPPVHKFDGHQHQVKEFLWRFRGGIADNIDAREFQLVTWGTDRDLRLHQVDEGILGNVGYRKGQPVRPGLTITRRGAPYRTFRDAEEGSQALGRPQPTREFSYGSDSFKDDDRSGAINAGMKKAPIPLSRGWGAGVFTPTSTGMQARQNKKKVINPIDWMKGVKIGKREVGHAYSRHGAVPGIPLDFMSRLGEDWEAPESLGDEITHAAARYKKVAFERVDIQQRLATIAMNGPWGADGKSVYVKLTVKFPANYPTHFSAPQFEVEKTTSIPQSTADALIKALRYIAEAYVTRRRTCLEAIISYLLGETSLMESTEWLLEEDHAEGVLDPDALAGPLSSDDEDNLELGQGTQLQDMENSGTEALGTLMSNANVPLPKGCGAMFARDGRLVCFFPPKDERPTGSLGALFVKDNERYSKAYRLFEGFGRLEAGSPDTKMSVMSPQEDQSGGSDSDDPYTSSTSSSGSSTSSEDLMESKLEGFPRWRASRLNDRRFAKALSTDNSQLSIGPGSSSLRVLPSKPKSVVSLQHLDGLIPAKLSLAREYIFFGDGPSVCAHNASVAARHGFHDLAIVWEFARLILHNQVPLELCQAPKSNEQILVMADRAVLLSKRRDSGLDLAFDDEPTPLDPQFVGRVRWGQHPFGGSWAVDAMFKHFEHQADIQMLAMLSCVFIESADDTIVPPEAGAGLNLEEKSLPMLIPAFSLDYFSSFDAAREFYCQRTLPFYPTSTLPQTPADRSSVAGSSEGHWGLQQPFNTPRMSGSTPSSSFKADRPSGLEKLVSQVQSVAGSPERHDISRRSTTTLTSALAASFHRVSGGGGGNGGSGTIASASTSAAAPPLTSWVKKRPSPVQSGSGSLTPGAVTWGATTFIGPSLGEPAPHSGSRYSDAEGVDEDGDDDDNNNNNIDDEAEEDEFSGGSGSGGGGGENGEVAQVRIKNPSLFDFEGSPGVPLLEPGLAARCRGYRASYATLLGVWRLKMQRLELLKFNGLPTGAGGGASALNMHGKGGGNDDGDDDEDDDDDDNDDDDCWSVTGFSPFRPGLEVCGTCSKCGDVLQRRRPTPGTGTGTDTGGGGGGGRVAAVVVAAEGRSDAGPPKAQWQCRRCGNRLEPRLACALCCEAVVGLYTPCLACGHVYHATCHEAWFGRQLRLPQRRAGQQLDAGRPRHQRRRRRCRRRRYQKRRLDDHNDGDADDEEEEARNGGRGGDDYYYYYDDDDGYDSFGATGEDDALSDFRDNEDVDDFGGWSSRYGASDGGAGEAEGERGWEVEGRGGGGGEEVEEGEEEEVECATGCGCRCVANVLGIDDISSWAGSGGGGVGGGGGLVPFSAPGLLPPHTTTTTTTTTTAAAAAAAAASGPTTAPTTTTTTTTVVTRQISSLPLSTPLQVL